MLTALGACSFFFLLPNLRGTSSLESSPSAAFFSLRCMSLTGSYRNESAPKLEVRKQEQEEVPIVYAILQRDDSWIQVVIDVPAKILLG